MTGKKGRKRALTDDEAKEARFLYYRGAAPNGKAYSLDMLGRLFGVSAATIANAIKGNKPYKRRGS